MLSLPVEQKGVDPDEMQEQIRTGGIAALGIEEVMLAAYRALAAFEP